MVFVVKEPKPTTKGTERTTKSRASNEPSTKSDDLGHTAVCKSSKTTLPVSHSSTSGQRRLPETERTSLAFTNPGYRASCSTRDLSIVSEVTADNPYDVHRPVESIPENLYQRGSDALSPVHIQDSEIKVFYDGDTCSAVIEPVASTERRARKNSAIKEKLVSPLMPFFNPSLVLLILSGSLRNSGNGVYLLTP